MADARLERDRSPPEPSPSRTDRPELQRDRDDPPARPGSTAGERLPDEPVPRPRRRDATLPVPPETDLGPRLLAGVGYALFGLVAIDRLGGGPLQALDEPLFGAVPHTGPLFEVSAVATHIGDTIVLASITLLGILLLLRRGRFVDAGVLGFAYAGEVLVVHGLKLLFARTRPGLVDGPYDAVCCAFPSGHATATAMVFMLLAVLFFDAHDRWRPWAEGVAIGMALVMAATRVVVGAHWPTDVVAGVGLGWGLAGSFLLLRAWLERKKALPNVAPGEAVAQGVGLYLP